MTKLDKSKMNQTSFMSKLKMSWRGLKQVRRIFELDGLVGQNRALQNEVKNLQVSLENLQKRIEMEWGPEHVGGIGPIDSFYYGFEEYFRGSREDVKNRLKVYLPYVEQVRNIGAPGFLDIGCGRGEWLELLAENNIPARGIDLNAHMIHESRNRSFSVEQADVFEYLQQIPDNSLSGITGFHIIEHLSFNMLLSILTEAWRTLASGGILILETPNPENLLVGSCNFYADPTHRRPILPPTLSFMFSHAGFKKQECVRVSIPQDQYIVTGAPHSPTVDLLKNLSNRMNVGQDYAMIAFKQSS